MPKRKPIALPFSSFCARIKNCAVGPIQIIQPSLRPRRTDDPRPCLCCMPCPCSCDWAFLFQQGFNRFEPHSFLQLSSFVLPCPPLPVNVFSVPHQCLCCCLLGHVSFMLIILPSPILRTCQRGTATPRSFISQKTAPAGPLTFAHDVASQTCRFHVSLTSSSHCPTQTACAKKHAAAHANSCSIPRLLISDKSESETDGFFPAALTNCLR